MYFQDLLIKTEQSEHIWSKVASRYSREGIWPQDCGLAGQKESALGVLGAVQEDRQAWSGLARLGQVKHRINMIAESTSLTISINVSAGWAFRVSRSFHCRSSTEQIGMTCWAVVLWLPQCLCNLQPLQWDTVLREGNTAGTYLGSWLDQHCRRCLHKGGKEPLPPSEG